MKHLWQILKVTKRPEHSNDEIDTYRVMGTVDGHVFVAEVNFEIHGRDASVHHVAGVNLDDDPTGLMCAEFIWATCDFLAQRPTRPEAEL